MLVLDLKRFAFANLAELEASRAGEAAVLVDPTEPCAVDGDASPLCAQALFQSELFMAYAILNADRAIGTRLAGDIARRRRAQKLTRAEAGGEAGGCDDWRSESTWGSGSTSHAAAAPRCAHHRAASVRCARRIPAASAVGPCATSSSPPRGPT